VPLELAIAWRYLASSRRRAHVALVSAISVGGLAVGVAALVLSIALLTGFQDRIRERLARDTPHLLVGPASGAFLADPAGAARALARLGGLESVTSFVEGRGWLADAEYRTALPVKFRSSAAIVRGEASVTSAVAGPLGAGRGTSVRAVANRSELTPLGAAPVSVPLRITRVLAGPGGGGSPEIELSLEDARALAGSADAISGLAARLRSPGSAAANASRLAAELGDQAVVRTWIDLNPGLTFALRMEKALIFVTVFLIVVVAALNVVSDLALLVVEKRRDLGILSTLGAAGGSLSKIYWWLGGTIGLFGTAAGAGIGAGLSWALDRFALVPLPADVYLMSHVPFALHARDLALVVGFSLSAAMAAAILPARAAGRVGPSEALRLSR